MKNLLLILLFLTGITPVLMAQDRQIQGIIFDNGNKQRLNRVYIYNTRTDKGIYNNTKGEFTLQVQKGDTIVVAVQGYSPDTATIKTQNVLLFYLKRASILLDVVRVTDSTRASPDKEHAENQEAYKEIYRLGNSKDLLTFGSGGVGLGIDAIYSLFSRQGKNARFLQKIIERDYHDAIIDYRFTKRLVASVTNLNGDALKDFMQQYRPSYYFVLQANDYLFTSSIRSSYESYLRNPAANRLPSLKN